MRVETEVDFTRAFNTILSKDPSKPPSPLQLSVEFGLGPQTSLRGDLAALRARLLERNGFVKVGGRWQKS